MAKFNPWESSTDDEVMPSRFPLPSNRPPPEEPCEIGAVNCIRIENGVLTGYNTDAYGFEQSLLGLINAPDLPSLQALNLHALILGTGGSSKAVAYVLKQLNIPFQYVSRTRSATSAIRANPP